jgi:hypothetical protein
VATPTECYDCSRLPFAREGRTFFHKCEMRFKTRRAVELELADWHRFTPRDFEYDFDRDKLFEHRVSFDEAVECFFEDFEIRRNKDIAIGTS